MAALQLIGSVFAAILQTVGVRSATEQPRYTVLEHLGPIEVRRYEGRVAAEAVVGGGEEAARNDGFRQVAGYIFGGNVASAQISMTAPVVQAARGEQIAMTAPVVQAPQDGAWRIQFIMPAKYTLDSLPPPTNPKVRLVQLPPQTYAVLSFSGSRAPGAVATWQRRLADGLRGSHWKSVGGPQSWFYDPPWTLPFLRLNEAAVQVDRS